MEFNIRKSSSLVVELVTGKGSESGSSHLAGIIFFMAIWVR